MVVPRLVGAGRTWRELRIFELAMLPAVPYLREAGRGRATPYTNTLAMSKRLCEHYIDGPSGDKLTNFKV